MKTYKEIKKELNKHNLGLQLITDHKDAKLYNIAYLKDVKKTYHEVPVLMISQKKALENLGVPVFQDQFDQWIVVIKK